MTRPRILLFVVGAILATAVRGQSAITSDRPATPASPRSPDFGTSDLTSYTAGALEFSTFDQSDTWLPIPGTPNRYLTSGTFEVALHLPTGASVEVIEIEGCDDSATGSLAGVFAAAAVVGGGGALASFDTGGVATPGCARFPVTVTPPVTVDSENQKYFFQLGNSPADGSTNYGAARVYYRLQVSPAPVTATFLDVPTTDGAFQFVEAFVAAGITAGCGGSNYCPDAPVTRRQMAVFFAKALGLHFPAVVAP